MTRFYQAGTQKLYDENIPYAAGSKEYYDYVAKWRARALGLPDWHTGRQYVEDIDHKGQDVPTGYTATYDALGKLYYTSANGGQGKAGGAGNVNPGGAVDNSWNELDGADVRTDEQKFYDRNLSDYQQLADEYGRYSWYATETGYDPKNPNAKRRLNLDALADRGKDQIATTDTPDSYVRDKQAGWSGHEYWKYNGQTDKTFFEDALRNRKNVSIYGRTA